MGSAHEFADCWAHGQEPVADPRFGSLEGPALAASDMYPAATHQLLPPLLISARPAADFDPAGYQVRPARVSRALADGDQVDLGDRSFTVLHLPGHSPGSIGLYDEHDGTLFSGDVICDGPLIDDIVGCDIADYLATMHRLRDLPVRLVHAGHEHDFGQARMHELIDDYIAART